MSRSVARRTFVLGAAALAACSRSERDALGGPPPRPPSPSSSVRIVELDLGRQAWGPGRAVLLLPSWGASTARYPLLVALHGRGEALKAPAEGAMGWPRDYALVRAYDRVRAPPLTPMDYEGLVEPAHLSETNASLFQRPFQGLVVACPYLPDLHAAATADIAPLARFVLDVLLPAARAQAPVLPAPDATGIDGVSLGGILALRIGLGAPDRFAAVGALQPAFANAPIDPDPLTALALSARARRPDLKLRLVTSHDDYFHDPIVAQSRAWTAAGVSHEFADLPGPHDYVFNRGPGSLELLLWHDRVLAHGANLQ